MIEVKIELPDILKGKLSDIGKAAAYRGINRAIDGVVTDVSREIRAVYNVAKSEVDKRLKKNYAKDYENLTGSVDVVAKDEQRSNLPLVLFGATSRTVMGGVNVKTKVSRQGELTRKQMKNAGRLGVAFKVMKSGGKGFRADAQIIKGGGSSWQVAVFNKAATGKKRLRELRVISVPEMLRGRHGAMERVIAAAEKRLKDNVESALAYYLANPDKVSGKGGRGGS